MRLAAQVEIGMEPFPGYHLCKFLGRGSWGEVWEAETAEGRRVALKFLTCENPQAAAQEIRALQVVRQLSHPNLIRIHQVWCHLGYIIISMELAEGSLLDLPGTGEADAAPSIARVVVCHYLGHIAAGLDFLNARQHQVNGCRVALRHCDVKPSNLLLFGDTAKLADFSVSTQSTSPLWYHKRGGTLDYAAPEVFQGRLSDRTDQYALGVTYCQLRGGRLPFPNTPESFTASYSRPRPDLTMVPAEERPSVERALATVPQDRWPSCTDFIRELAGRGDAGPKRLERKIVVRQGGGGGP